MKCAIYINGTITGPAEAKLPALDRGFLFGDSVYEVLWRHGGVLIQAQDHLNRLRRSAALLYMDLPYRDDEFIRAIEDTASAAGMTSEDEAYVRLVVSRGSGPCTIDITTAPTRRLMVVVQEAQRPSERAIRRGLHARLVSRKRMPTAALAPAAKTGNYLNSVLALHEAHREGADDAIFTTMDGHVAEASTSNVYWWLGDTLYTPSLDCGILEGTTRVRLLSLCRDADIPVAEVAAPPRALQDAGEIFLCSSIRGVMPVTTLDGVAVGTGEAGPRTLDMVGRFEAAADAEARAGVRDRH